MSQNNGTTENENTEATAEQPQGKRFMEQVARPFCATGRWIHKHRKGLQTVSLVASSIVVTQMRYDLTKKIARTEAERDAAEYWKEELGFLAENLERTTDRLDRSVDQAIWAATDDDSFLFTPEDRDLMLHDLDEA